MDRETQKAGVQPLADVKVVELGALIAGPYAASILAQFGAEVTKIEAPAGDPLRRWRKLYKGTSLWWYSQNRNKKSVTVDLRHEAGQRIIRALVRDADIVIENFRPGILEKWHLGWDTLSALNPKLVMVRVSGYGQTGPYRDRPGFASIAESIGGLRYVSGYADRAPVRVGVSLGDTLAALYGVIGGLIALHHVRSHPGEGQFIDVALYEAVFGAMESLIPEYAMYKIVRERSGASLPGIVPSNTYRCSDGHYVIVGGNGDGIFRRLMKAIGRVDLAEDPDLAHNDGRVAHTQMLDDVISGWTSKLTLEEAIRVMSDANVPCGPVYTAADIYRDPQYRARGMIEKHTLPDGEPIEIPGIVPKLSATPGRTTRLGPGLGEDTDAVLEHLGYTKQAIAELRAAGTI